MASLPFNLEILCYFQSSFTTNMSYKNVKSSGYGTRKSQVAEEAFPTSPQPKSIFRPKQWNLQVEDGKMFFSVRPFS